MSQQAGAGFEMPSRQQVLEALMTNPQALGSMPHAALYQARAQPMPQELQNQLAGFEHQAFTREATAENPLMALPLAVATPAYQIYKAIKPGSRSEGGLGQMGQGMYGILEGLKERFANR
jgi:hypothetical protein